MTRRDPDEERVLRAMRGLSESQRRHIIEMAEYFERLRRGRGPDQPPPEDPPGGTKVREPRRPRPPRGSSGAALPEPRPERAPDAIAAPPARAGSNRPSGRARRRR